MIKTYYMLTKPGIIMGNVITVAAGFALAAKGHIDGWLFLATLGGLALVIASAAVFNNYLDRQLDAKMERTKNRALVKGLISPKSAIAFAILLGLIGSTTLLLFTNLLTTLIALTGFFVYVVLYGFWKPRSLYSTLIGSIAGAVPPVIGYTAVSNRLDLAALVLFAILALWQMPHFFAIAIYRVDEYAAAKIPVMPVKKGVRTTKIHMLFYTLAFIVATFMPIVFGLTGLAYLVIAALLGLIWLGICLRGFKAKCDKRWARQMFYFSLVIIPLLCLMLSIDGVK